MFHPIVYIKYATQNKFEEVEKNEYIFSISISIEYEVYENILDFKIKITIVKD